MTIAITTPTGHIGSVVADRLSGGSEDVILLVRDPKKVQHLVDRGAKAIATDQADGDAVVQATKGADALFWVTAPNVQSDDFRAFQNLQGKNAARAIEENKIEHVVNISSIGAHLGEKTGPINGLHDVEKRIDEVAQNVVHLRPAMFFENQLANLGSIQAHGSIFAPVAGGKSVPMIATKDIGEAAARILSDRTWTGRNVLGLHGPRDLTFDEVASIIGDAIGKTVTHVQVPPEAAFAALTQFVSQDMANLYVEMYTAIETGTFEIAEQRTAETTTPTTFEQFAEEVIAPANRG